MMCEKHGRTKAIQRFLGYATHDLPSNGKDWHRPSYSPEIMPVPHIREATKQIWIIAVKTIANTSP